MFTLSHSPAPHVSLRRQRGIALPVMLIMLVVMLLTSVYLLRSSNSTTMAVSNLAYDAALSRAADLGLHAGFEYLMVTARTNKKDLEQSNKGAGYVATMVPDASPRDASFWTGSTFIDDVDQTRVEYVIHRICANAGSILAPTNRCVTSVPSNPKPGNSLGQGESLTRTVPDYNEPARQHYVITARIVGPRGGNVVNQMTVTVGV